MRASPSNGDDHNHASVRVEVDHLVDPASVEVVPSVERGTRSSPIAIFAMLAIACGAVALLATTGTEETVPEAEVASTVPANAEQGREASALSSRVGEPATSPAQRFGRVPAGPIHRSGRWWYSTDQDRQLVVSNDLLQWRALIPDRNSIGLALDSSTETVRVLARSGLELQVLDADARRVLETDRVVVDAQPSVGTLRGDRWAVAWTEGSARGSVTRIELGVGDERVDTVELAGPVQALALTDTNLVVSTLLGSSGLTTQATILTVLPLTEDTPTRCHLLQLGELSQTPDGVIHFSMTDSSWIVNDDATELTLVLTAADLDQLRTPPAPERSIRPLPSGGGWSIVADVESVDGGTERHVWITRNGEQLADIDLPSIDEPYGHVLWADQGAQEGIGLRIETSDTPGLFRVWDPRYWHPRPSDLSRLETISPREATMQIDSTDCLPT